MTDRENGVHARQTVVESKRDKTCVIVRAAHSPGPKDSQLRNVEDAWAKSRRPKKGSIKEAKGGIEYA